MINQLSPTQAQEAVNRGFQRFSNDRKTRMRFIRAYVGPFYNSLKGKVGEEALGLIYNAAKILTAQVVGQNPTHKVNSQSVLSMETAKLLGLTLKAHDRSIDIKTLYRRVFVDALFMIGIAKTGLVESDSVYAFNQYDQYDTGTVYTHPVDFDNFVADPRSREHMFVDAAWMGDRVTVSRQSLLDSGLYDNELIERLPTAGELLARNERADYLSKRGVNTEEDYDDFDDVEITEIWCPGDNVILTVPGSKDVLMKDYLRVDDAYCSKKGPYSLLAVNPPVPGNPMPVSSVGVWYDLHTMANRMASKIWDQAERQKDVIAYQKNVVDDMEEVKNARDGEAVAVDNIDAIKVLPLGGQRQSNEVHLAALQAWFNQMAGNPMAMAGIPAQGIGSATEFDGLQANAGVGIADIKSLTYEFGAAEASKRAWLFATDPFLHYPLIRRVEIPGQMVMGPMGPMMQPGRMEDQQVVLTPDMISNDFMEFTYEILTESMTKKDSRERYKECIEFATQILPAAFQAAQAAAALLIPFDAKKFVELMAEERGIEWMPEVWFDPMFQMRMAMMFMQGPQDPGKAGGGQKPNAGLGGGGGNPLAAILQNGQPGQVMGGAPSPTQQFNQQAQMGAVDAQQDLKMGGGF